MASAAASRPYQVVVWGASGFTGRLVCEHLCRDYSGRVRWAMAGRDARRLEAVRDELSRINPDVKNVPILVADASDKAALSSVMKQTQVVLALVGPFAKYGDQVVAQAVEEGTHYCDITGETPWVKRNVSKYDSSAKSKGVKVVHCCGYDSIPSDLGALMMATYCQTVLKKKIAQIYHLVSCKGTLSGGTVASGINMVEGEPMKELMAMTTNAYYITNGTGPDRPAPSIPTYIKEAGVWAGPFMMESCNARIVHYSNSIRPQGPYGPNFKFCEVSNCGTGWNGWLGAVGLSAVTAVAGMVFTLAPLRALAKRALPAPGQGPSLEARVNGWWKHTLIAVTDEPEGGKPLVVKGECGDKRDPGYWSTSRMILETGLALVLDEDAIAKSGTCLPGGVLTPATAAGMVLVDRLNKAGYTFKVDGVVGEDGKVVPESKVQAEALISSRKA